MNRGDDDDGDEFQDGDQDGPRYEDDYEEDEEEEEDLMVPLAAAVTRLSWVRVSRSKYGQGPRAAGAGSTA